MYRWIGLGVGFLALLYGTVAVFMVFNRDANSVSDVIRPFIITMAPVWAVGIAGAMAILRWPRSGDQR
jgi:hypothetical protein